jgi:hypothetical protein
MFPATWITKLACRGIGCGLSCASAGHAPVDADERGAMTSAAHRESGVLDPCRPPIRTRGVDCGLHGHAHARARASGATTSRSAETGERRCSRPDRPDHLRIVVAAVAMTMPSIVNVCGFAASRS